jgi:O-antigen ligase
MPTYIFYLYSFVIGLGTYDPIFAQDGPFGIVEISLLALGVICIIYYHSNLDVIKCALHKFRYPILIVLFLLFSSIVYSTQNFSDIYIDYKLIASVCSFFLICLIINEKESLIMKSLFFFTLGVSFFVVMSFIGIIPQEYNRYERLLILDENPNSTSSRMALAVLFILHLFVFKSNEYKHVKYIMLLFIPFLFYAILQSGSRGSFVTLLLSLTVMFVYSYINNKRGRIYVFLIGGVSILIFFSFIANTLINMPIYGRLQQSIEEQSVGSRSDIWHDAMKIGYDNFIVGVGEKGYEIEMISRYGYYVDTHNLFICLFVTGGILTCIPFLLFYKNLVECVYRYFLIYKVFFPVILLLFTTFIAVKTGGILYSKSLWYYFALIISCKKV